MRELQERQAPHITHERETSVIEPATAIPEVAAPTVFEQRGPSVVDAIRFLRRHWLLMVGASAAAAVAMVIALQLFLPRRFEAAATLVVVPQTFKSELKPPVLTVQGYQRLLESNAVVAEAGRRLAEAGTIEDPTRLRLGENIKTRIFVSRRAEETALAPMIDAAAYGDTAEQAGGIANTWADVFLERSQLVFSESLSPTIELIEGQYGTQRDRLRSLEQEFVTASDEYQRRLDETALRWDRRILEAKKKTEDLTADYFSETRQVMESLADSVGLRNPETTVADVGSMSDDSISADVERRLSEVLSLRTQLAQTPQVRVLEKAVSDDTLWQAIALNQSQIVDLQSIMDKKLLTQEANSVYNDLALRLSEIETAVAALDPAARVRVQTFIGRLEQLQVQRSAGLTKLIAERALEGQILLQKRAQEIESLTREKSMMLGRLQRGIRHSSDLYEKLAENFNEATLAKAASGTEEVRLAAPAVAAEEDRRVLLKTLLAAIVGGFVGVVIAIVREVGTG